MIQCTAQVIQTQEIQLHISYTSVISETYNRMAQRIQRNYYIEIRIDLNVKNNNLHLKVDVFSTIKSDWRQKVLVFYMA